MHKAAKIVLSVFLAAIILPVAYLIVQGTSPTKFAPVRMEPKQLVSSQDGTHKIKLTNESDKALDIHFHYEITPSSGVASVYGGDYASLLPREQQDLELTIDRYPEYEGIPITVIPKVQEWQKVMKTPVRKKMFLSFSRVLLTPLGPHGSSFHSWVGQAINAYYVNESDRPLWVSVDVSFEPQPHYIVVYTSLELGERYVEPGEAIWYYISYGYGGPVTKSPGWHWTTLVVDVREYLSKPEHAQP